MDARPQRAGFHTVTVSDTRRTLHSFTVPTRYTNLRFINAGSEGAVVSADVSTDQNQVAIKKRSNLIGKSAKNAIREFILLTSVKHPNIIPITHVFTPQEDEQSFKDVYLVMERMKYTLSEVISKMPLNHKTLKFFIYQILCAVNHLHRQGIIHRDLKPCNVAVNGRCEVKLLDFGLSRMFSPIDQMTGYVTTTHYRAPELLLECLKTPENLSNKDSVRALYSTKVDIWSIGCIFYELITRKIMFPGNETVSQWNKIAEIMGTPTDGFVSKLDTNLANRIRTQCSAQPQTTRQTFDDLVLDSHFICPSSACKTCKTGKDKHLIADAADARRLLSKLLEYEPKDRYSAAEALHDSYFKSCFKADEVDAPLTACEYIHEVDQGNLALEDLKSLIFKEVKRIESSYIPE
ncbi:hypothetical protein PENTCL1PPCAC_24112 [Pristionchus entomophagus]|uniref:Protein kinase domain-containing protein n=1 Tax=Pristionchus entomophagus TaxID=358040 RepID=A0AAV5U5N1_9BILA|nr:hypothetical protein PENTCL1PPCAC_24112 [Pristionchus entomophagus]